jgi:cellulose synthase/poly-beta-1,6-N-acetylglucosamine synthase-like glycosyltransferase
MISILFIGSGILYALFIFSCFYGWKKTKLFSPDEKNFKTRVTVIIPARNEEKNILTCLNSISQQNFPKLLTEVIVVDDHSEDDTFSIVSEWAVQQSVSVKIISLTTGTGKKNAINEALKTATGELIVSTDADCMMTHDWLSTIVSRYEIFSPDMIAGMVSLSDESIFLSRFQLLELAGLTAIGTAGIYFHHPFLCNGANLAYTKNIFEESGGYDLSKESSSGDDTMLLLHIAKKNPRAIHFLKSHKAIVTTSPSSSWTKLMQQRKRWGSKVIAQGNILAIAISFMVFLFHCAVVASLILSLFGIESWKIPAMLLFLKIFSEFILLSDVLSFYQKKISVATIILSQLLYIPFLIIAVLISQSGKYDWKGRKVS